jgi:WD40 repeat protein
LTALSAARFAYGQAAKPQIALQTGHYGSVISAAYSPDSKTLATVSEDWNVKLWDASTGHVVRTMFGHTASLTSVSFSADGSFLATGGYDTTIRLWSAKNGNQQSSLADPDRNIVTAIAISPNNRLVASGVGSGGAFLARIRIWDLAKKSVKLTINEDSQEISQVAFTPDARFVVSGGKDGKLKIWNVTTGGTQLQWDAHTGEIASFAISSDGKKIFSSGAADGVIKVWDMSSGALQLTIPGENNQPNYVALSPDNKKLAIGNGDVNLYDAVTGKPQQPLVKKTISSNKVLFSPDGKTVANLGVSLNGTTSSADVYLWESQEGNFQRKLTGYTLGVVFVVYKPDGKALIAADSDRRLAFWDLRAGTITRTLQLTEEIKSLAISADGKLMAVAGGDFGQAGSITLLDAASGEVKRKLTGHLLPVRSVTFSRDGTRLVSGSEDGKVKIWNVGSGAEERTITNSPLPVLTVAYSSDERAIITGGHDGKVRIWDTNSGLLLHTLEGQTSGVFALALSADAKLMASSGSATDKINFWELASGEQKGTIRDNLFSPTSILFTRNSILAVSNANGRVLLWNKDEGHLVGELTVHELGGSAIALSPNKRFLASAGHDGAIHLVDLISGKRRAILYQPRPDEIAGATSIGNSSGQTVEYITITDAGYYLATPRSEASIRMRMSNQLFATEHFHSRYYRPKLVRKSLTD